jgi:hypothetical protein
MPVMTLVDLRNAAVFGIYVVGNDAAPPHHHNAVHNLKDMMDIVGNENARRMSRITGPANEAKHPLACCHTIDRRIAKAVLLCRLIPAWSPFVTTTDRGHHN